MTEPTEAHRAEARRRLAAINYAASCHQPAMDLLAQALAEPAWTPTEDPDLVEARECAALAWGEAPMFEASVAAVMAGKADHTAPVQSALIAIKRRQA